MEVTGEMGYAGSEYYRAERAHMIAESLGIPFGAAWRVMNCVCKRTYDSEADATAEAEKWGQEAYRCDICGKWHARTARNADEA